MVYPVNKDTFPSTLPTSPRPGHSALHNMISVAVRAIEDKLGIDSSADASTIDYKLKNPGSVDPGHRHTYATIVGLGTAATVDIGTTANKIIALDSFGKLPAVDGSQLINLPPHPLSGDVFGVPSGIVQDNELVLWSGIDGKHIKASGILSSTVASAIANAHSHANKALLDTYTQLDADIVSAVSLKHAHSNKAILDGIASAPVESVTSPDGSIVVTRVGNAVTVSSTGGGGQIIFDAIVAPTGGDYTKLSDAIAAGKKTIFYRKGTYVETDEIIITLDNTIIVGESWETYQIQQHPTGNNGIRIDGANNCIITNFTVDCEAFSQWSALQIIDGQPAGSPDATKGCNNTIFKMNLKGNQTGPLETGKFCLYLAGINAAVDQATVEYDADRLCTGNQIIGCTMSSGYQGDAFVFGLQKNSRFEGNRCIGGRIAPYMLKNCSINNNEVIDSVSQGIALSFPSQNVDIAHNRIWNPAAQGVLTNNQLEHDFTTSIGNNITIHDNKIYSPGSNGIGVTGGTTKNLGVVSGAFISITDNQIFDGGFHGIYLQDINNFLVKNNIIRDVNTTNNSRGSGVYMVRNVKDGSIEGNIINDSRGAGALMRHSIASREGNTCTDNSIIGNKISGTYLDRNIWTDSDGWIIANNHIAGGKYAGVFFQNANKASVIGNYFKNNTNDANNAWGEVWINGTASNIIVDNNIFESNATNKAKYGVWVEAATSSGIQIGQNLFIGMQTANVGDSGAGTLYQVIAPKGTGSTKFLREDLTWQTVAAGGGTWGSITGTLSAQTDLQNALNAKQNALTNPITGTGTTQQIPYFIGSTNLTSDSRLFWDYTNYRLGIGTSSPAGNLHIVGKDNGTASIRLEKTGTNAGVFQIYNDGFANIVGPGAGPNRRFAFYDQMGAGSGSEALPPFTNFGDLNTGMHFPSADTIGWSTGGTTRFTLNNTTAVFTGALSASNLSGTNTGDQDLSPYFKALYGGCLTGHTYTDNGNGTINVPSIDVNLWDNSTFQGVPSKYTLAAVNNMALTDGVMNYIVGDYNGGSPIQKVITDISLITESSVIPLISIFRDGNFLHAQNWDALGVGLANKVHQSIVKTQRYRRESGLSISESGTRNLNLTAGRVWVGGVPVDLDNIATSTDNMFFWYHSAGVWTVSTVTQYNNTQYDDGTNLVSLNPNRYAVNWIYRGVENQKHLYCIPGTGDYTLQQALDSTEPAKPINISSHAVLVGRVIVQNGASTAQSIRSAFDTTFGSAGITAHTDLTNLAWSSSGHTGTANNIPAFDGSGAATQIAPGTSGNVLTSNGTSWVSQTPADSTSVSATQSTFVAGENLTAGNSVGVPKFFKTSDIAQLTGTSKQNFNNLTHGQTIDTSTLNYIETITLYTNQTDYLGGWGASVKIYADNTKTVLLGSSGFSFPHAKGDFTQIIPMNIDVSAYNSVYIFIDKNGYSSIDPYIWLYYNASNVYAGGTRFQNDVAQAGDLKFSITGGAKNTTGKVFKTDASFFPHFIGFANETVTEGNTLKVNTAGIDPNQSGLTFNSKYYMSNIRGTISTTPGTNIVPVGIATSATSIQIDTISNVKSQPLITPTVGASPYTYQNTTGNPVTVSITGGTVSQVAISRDNSNFYQTSGATNTFVVLGVNDYVKITYTGAPTLKVFTF